MAWFQKELSLPGNAHFAASGRCTIPCPHCACIRWAAEWGITDDYFEMPGLPKGRR